MNTPLQIAIQRLGALQPEIEPYLYVVPLRYSDEEGAAPTETAYASPKEFVFNRQWFDGLLPHEQCFMLAHEAHHAAHGHITEPKGHRNNHNIANLAMDLVIDNALDEAPMGSGVVSRMGTTCKILKPDLPPELDPIKSRLSSMSWEEVYDFIMSLPDDSSYKAAGGQAGADEHHFDGAEEGMQAAMAQLKDALEQAKVMAESIKAGREVGGQLNITTAKPTPTPWQTIFAEYLKHILSTAHLSWRKLNRRDFARDGAYKPSRRSHVPELPRMLLLVDTSGSMRYVLPTVLADVKAISTQLGVRDIVLRTYDTSASEEIPLVVAGVEHALPTTLEGGGGTYITKILEELADEYLGVEQLVAVATDGYDKLCATMESLQPDLWLVYDHAAEGNTGKTIRISVQL